MANEHENKESKTSPIVVLKEVNVKYNLGEASEFHALKNISIKIYPGEFVIFFGPSGCGKSTLLNVIAGLEAPCKGKVEVDGDDILEYDYDQLSSYHVDKLGMIFQAYNLIESLTIEDNIGLPRMFKNESKAKRRQCVKELLERFKILEHAKKRPTLLSGGQQQRAGVARALVNEPLILLADEPIGNLDSVNAEIVIRIFKELNNKDKKTLILVTHNPELLEIAHRVIHMKDGFIVKEEVNRDVRPDFVRKEVEEEKIDVPRELKLLLRSYGGLTIEQINSMWVPLKAKVIAAQILNKYTTEQIKLIEQSIKQRIMGLIGREELFNLFDRPLEEGGADLDRRTAEALVDRVENILEEVKKIKEYTGMKERAEDLDKEQGVIIEIRRHLMSFSHGHVIQENVDRLDKFLRARLDSKIDKKKFINSVSLSLKKGGAGFNKRTAKKFGRELEMFMLIKFGEERQ